MDLVVKGPHRSRGLVAEPQSGVDLVLESTEEWRFCGGGMCRERERARSRVVGEMWLPHLVLIATDITSTDHAKKCLTRDNLI